MNLEMPLMIFGDMIHVTFYLDVAAAILVLGVLVLCSRGIIRDAVEAKLFRLLLLAVFVLAVSEALNYAGLFADIPAALSMLLQTVNELMLSAALIMWLVYVEYRLYRSRDDLKRRVVKRLIPMFIVVGLELINPFTGILFTVNMSLVVYGTIVQGLCEVVRLVYIISSSVRVVKEKKARRDLKFFAIAEFILPVIAAYLLTGIWPYSMVPLGFAVGLTCIYAGIINETSFQDQETGYYNRFYLPSLKKEITEGSYRLKNGMIFRLGREEDTEAFSKLLNPILPKKCIMIRFDRKTFVMLAEINERVALHMMKEDARDAIQEHNSKNDEPDIQVAIDMIMKREGTPAAFYDELFQRVKRS